MMTESNCRCHVPESHLKPASCVFFFSCHVFTSIATQLSRQGENCGELTHFSECEAAVKSPDEKTS